MNLLFKEYYSFDETSIIFDAITDLFDFFWNFIVASESEAISLICLIFF